MNALLAELIFCYLPWKPNGGWQRANIGFTFKRSGFMYLLHCIISVLLLVAVVGIFHNDEYEKDAQRLSENVFRLMDYELSSWEEQDIGLLRLNALVQISRLDGIAHSLSEAAGVDMIVETEERQLLSTTVPENMILREQ